jgi:hypothetical protein
MPKISDGKLRAVMPFEKAPVELATRVLKICFFVPFCVWESPIDLMVKKIRYRMDNIYS